jgi:predicted TIM-barrel fold metal-dependent hydrolase
MIYVEKGEKVLRWYERLDKKSGEDIAIPLLSGAELRPLHDYLLHTYIQRANDEDIPVQIHTGYLAGIQRDLRNINPMQLIPLLLRYRNTRFDLFHAGWPYTEEMGAIGKNYPNVWISLCWAWTMNPIAVERALDSWLDCVPYNKIIGFGGDAKHPLAVYGYAIQAREGLARVFEKRIERGDMDEVLAKDAARAIMLTNGCELHGVPLPKAS